MAFSIFKAFRSTVTPFTERQVRSTDRVLVDPTTGAPIGFENPNANGPHARWTPVDITAAQLAAPTAAMLADLDATYRVNVAPYARYQSDGSQLISSGAAYNDVVVPPGFNEIFYDPLKVQAPQRLIVQGTVHVTAYIP